MPNLGKTLWSMLRSPQRMVGRSWLTELLVRLVQNIYIDSETKGLPWLRRTIENAGSQVRARVKVDVENIKIAGIDCVVSKPFARDPNGDAKSSRILIYLHGGGFVFGSPRGYQNLLSQLAHEANIEVIAPAYRLSPEHPFPAAQDDCLAVIKTVLDQQGAIRRTRGTSGNSSVFLAGDSAGGNLAVNACLQMAKERAQKMPDALMLISPWLDPTAEKGSIISNAPYDMFTKPFLDKSFAQHIGQASPHDPRIYFSDADLSELPRTYVQLAGGEVFYDQVSQFCDRATEQGVDLKLDVFPTQFHDFQTLSPILKDAKVAVQRLAAFVS